MKSVRARISGRVQGVWFRAWTCQQADLKELSGWVRNRRDGSVEAVFYGNDADVDAMLALCRDGPPLAGVNNVICEPCDAPAEAGFQSQSTA